MATEDRPATADAAQLAAGLAAASRMFSRGTTAEKEMSKDWMMAAKKALDFGVFNNGGKEAWWADVCTWPLCFALYTKYDRLLHAI